MKKQIIHSLAVTLCACLLTHTASAQVPYGNPGTPLANSSAELLLATGGDVTVTYVYGITFGDQDILWLGGIQLFDNQSSTVGATYDLGNFDAGTVLNFTMQDVTTGNTWSMGTGAVNSDGYVHAYVVDNYPSSGSSFVGWEDRTYGESYADFNYNDLTFTFTTTTPTPAPEPSTMVLAGLGGLLLYRRRSSAR